MAFGVVLAIGFTFEFAHRVWLEIVNGRRVNFGALPFYWLLWNLLPLTLLAIGRLVRRQGK